jgi:hypothetical protein
MTVFSDFGLYSLVEVDRRFKHAYCVNHQGGVMEAVGTHL